MGVVPYDYSIYFDFIESYMPSNFQNINGNNPIMRKLEEMMEENNQFFYIADLIQLKLLYTSKRSYDILGIPSEELEFSNFMETVHPADAGRLSIGRTKLLELAQSYFNTEKGTLLLSTNMRFRNATDEYSNLLLQNYIFTPQFPVKPFFSLKFIPILLIVKK